MFITYFTLGPAHFYGGAGWRPRQQFDGDFPATGQPGEDR